MSHVKTETCLLSSVFSKTLQHSNRTLLPEKRKHWSVSAAAVGEDSGYVCALFFFLTVFRSTEYRWKCYTRVCWYCELTADFNPESLSQARIAHVLFCVCAAVTCLPNLLPVKSVLVKKSVKCKMLRMSGIWRRIMGLGGCWRLMGCTTWGLPQVSWAITINCCAKGCSYISHTSASYFFIPSVDKNSWFLSPESSLLSTLKKKKTKGLTNLT